MIYLWTPGMVSSLSSAGDKRQPTRFSGSLRFFTVERYAFWTCGRRRVGRMGRMGRTGAVRAQKRHSEGRHGVGAGIRTGWAG